jgi:formylglycine-generating enzyme
LLAVGLVVLAPRNARPSVSDPIDPKGFCPPEMRLIEGAFCIDRFEANTAEVGPDGALVSHSPYQSVEGLRVKALSQSDVVPQAYISRNQAEVACHESQKRLCTDREWVTACKGPAKRTFPYGNAHKPGYCVDTNRVNPLTALFESLGLARYQFATMNDPALNQVPGTLAPTGTFAKCTNEYGVYDMVGNLHEWTADPQGTFRGGFYLDTKLNGSGCDYKTVAHPATYHDYSTGFRCCKDAGASQTGS